MNIDFFFSINQWCFALGDFELLGGGDGDLSDKSLLIPDDREIVDAFFFLAQKSVIFLSRQCCEALLWLGVGDRDVWEFDNSGVL